MVAACSVALLASCAVASQPASRRPVVSIAMPTPGSIVTAYGSVWVTIVPAQTLTRLDPRTNAVSARIPTPDPASVVGVGAGAIWVTSFHGNSLRRIDSRQDRVTRTISLAPGGAGPIGVTVFDGSVWVANHNGGPTTSVSKIDPATMRVVDVIPVGADDFAGPASILSSAGSIWTNVNSIPNVIVRIDPRTDHILATIPARAPAPNSPRTAPQCGAPAATTRLARLASAGSTRARTRSPRRSTRAERLAQSRSPKAHSGSA